MPNDHEYEEVEINPSLDMLLQLRACIDVSINAVTENARLRKEVEYWKDKHFEVVKSSISHSESVMAGMLQLAIAGRIKDA